jgi:hypothetical protein
MCTQGRLAPQTRHSPYHVVLLHFHAHFRSRFVLRADWPRACCWSANTMHRCAFISTLCRRPSMLTRAPNSLQRSIASRRSRPRDPPTLPFADLTAPRTQAKQRQLCSDRGAGQREYICDRVHEPRSKLYVSPSRMCRTAH